MKSSIVGISRRITIGTDKVRGRACTEYVQQALAAGYRQIDTAQAYENEEAIGTAIQRSLVTREEVCITTKISAGFKQNPCSVEEATAQSKRSLKLLGLDYVDKILIHHPGDDVANLEAARNRRVTWQALEAMLGKGYARSIGVSNYDVAHLNEMKQYARVLPTVNQIELHPWYQRRKLVSYCQSENILIEAYLAIARNSQSSDQKLAILAKKYKTSTAVILLCYSLQKGYSPIVRAQNPDHLLANLEAESICLKEEDLASMDEWDIGVKGSLLPWMMN